MESDKLSPPERQLGFLNTTAAACRGLPDCIYSTSALWRLTAGNLKPADDVREGLSPEMPSLGETKPPPVVQAGSNPGRLRESELIFEMHMMDTCHYVDWEIGF